MARMSTAAADAAARTCRGCHEELVDGRRALVGAVGAAKLLDRLVGAPRQLQRHVHPPRLVAAAPIRLQRKMCGRFEVIATSLYKKLTKHKCNSAHSSMLVVHENGKDAPKAHACQDTHVRCIRRVIRDARTAFEHDTAHLTSTAHNPKGASVTSQQAHCVQAQAHCAQAHLQGDASASGVGDDGNALVAIHEALLFAQAHLAVLVVLAGALHLHLLCNGRHDGQRMFHVVSLLLVTWKKY